MAIVATAVERLDSLAHQLPHDFAANGVPARNVLVLPK